MRWAMPVAWSLPSSEEADIFHECSSGSDAAGPSEEPKTWQLLMTPRVGWSEAAAVAPLDETGETPSLADQDVWAVELDSASTATTCNSQTGSAEVRCVLNKQLVIRKPCCRPTLLLFASGAAASAFALGALGGLAGMVLGALTGCASGFPFALVTLGLSLPLGALAGGALGTCSGAACGVLLGLAGAWGLAGALHSRRHMLWDLFHSFWDKLLSITTRWASDLWLQSMSISAIASGLWFAAAGGLFGLIIGAVTGALGGLLLVPVTLGLSVPLGALAGACLFGCTASALGLLLGALLGAAFGGAAFSACERLAPGAVRACAARGPAAW